MNYRLKKTVFLINKHLVVTKNIYFFHLKKIKKAAKHCFILIMWVFLLVMNYENPFINNKI